MMKKNKLFLALLFAGAISSALVKTADEEPLGWDEGFSDTDTSSDDEDSLEEHTETNNQEKKHPTTWILPEGFDENGDSVSPSTQTKQSILPTLLFKGSLLATEKGFEGFGTGAGAKLVELAFGIPMRLIVISGADYYLKSKKELEIEGINLDTAKHTRDLNKAQLAHKATEETLTIAQIALSKTQKEHADLTMLLDLTKGLTARETRLKKQLDEETLISNAKFAKEQARYQEATRRLTESKATSDRYESSIKTHRLFVGKDKEEMANLLPIWVDKLGKEGQSSQEKFLRENMKEALKLNNIQIALDRMDTQQRQEKELKKRGLKADENGVLIRERQLSMHEQEDDSEEEFSEQQLERDKQYDAVRESKIQELTKQLAFKPCTDPRALDSK